MKILIGLFIVFLLVGCTDQVIGPMAKDKLPDGAVSIQDETSINVSDPEPIPSPAPTQSVTDKKWTVINEWTGDGIKTTETFKVTKNTRVNWETTGAKSSIVVFNVDIMDSSGTSSDSVASTQNIGENVSYLHLPDGEYSLRIISANTKWKITIEQQ